MVRIRWAISIFFVIIVFVIAIYMNPEALRKRQIMNFYRSSIHGVVVDKYINVENHSNKQIVIQDFNDKTTNFILTPNNNEDIYSLITKNDTIVKNENSLNIVISNYKKETISIECCSFFTFFVRKAHPKCYSSQELSYYSNHKFSYYINYN